MHSHEEYPRKYPLQDSTVRSSLQGDVFRAGLEERAKMSRSCVKDSCAFLSATSFSASLCVVLLRGSSCNFASGVACSLS